MSENVSFSPIHSWNKGALAMAFVPNVESRSALKTFNRWIATYPGLLDSLIATGYAKSAKILTPAQVKLIFDAFGAP